MKITKSKLKQIIREEIQSLKEAYDYDKLDIKKPYGVFLLGGSIGSGSGAFIDRKTGAKLVSTFDDEGNAKRIAKTRNRRLSPGEKKFYGMKYTAIKMSRVKLITASVENSMKEVAMPLGSYLEHAIADVAHLIDVVKSEHAEDAYSSPKKSGKLLTAVQKLLKKVK